MVATAVVPFLVSFVSSLLSVLVAVLVVFLVSTGSLVSLVLVVVVALLVVSLLAVVVLMVAALVVSSLLVTSLLVTITMVVSSVFLVMTLVMIFIVEVFLLLEFIELVHIMSSFGAVSLLVAALFTVFVSLLAFLALVVFAMVTIFVMVGFLVTAVVFVVALVALLVMVALVALLVAVVALVSLVALLTVLPMMVGVVFVAATLLPVMVMGLGGFQIESFPSLSGYFPTGGQAYSDNYDETQDGESSVHRHDALFFLKPDTTRCYSRLTSAGAGSGIYMIFLIDLVFILGENGVFSRLLSCNIALLTNGYSIMLVVRTFTCRRFFLCDATTIEHQLALHRHLF